MTRIANLQSVCLLLACLLTVASVPAWAVDGDAHAAAPPYPDPDCAKPEARLIQPDGYDFAATTSYNLKVKRYNNQLKAYNDCLHAYVDKANGDIKLVQDTANSDMARIRDTANARMKEIERKTADAIATANAQAGESVTRSGGH